VNSRYLLHNFT